MKKKTEDDYKDLANSISLTWIGDTLPVNSTVKTKWRCRNGHEFTKSYKKLRVRPYCPYCKGLKYGKDAYESAANKYGYKWDGSVPKRSTEKVGWECPNGHKFSKSYSQMLRQPGCPQCVGPNRRNSAEDYYALASDRGLEWLGPLPGSSKTKTKWRCPKGHVFESRYNDVQQGYGCSQCEIKGTSRAELRLLAELKYIFKDVKWRYKKSGVECDVYIPSLRAAIEYDGSWWHKDKFNQDKAKNKQLADLKIPVFRIREHPLKKTQKHDVTHKHGKSLLVAIKAILGNILFANPSPKEARLIRQYLKRKRYADPASYSKYVTMLPSPPDGYSLADKLPEITAEWDYEANAPLKPEMFSPGSAKKVWWRCSKGHRYEQKIFERTGSKKVGCPYCSGKQVALNESFADKFPDLAEEWCDEKNDKAPTDYTPYSKKTVWWKAKCGHPAWDMPIYMRTGQQKSGCPYCAGKRIAIGESFADIYPDLANEWHPTLNKKLPNEYKPMSNSIVWWRCEKGHEWKQRICQRAIRRLPCPICVLDEKTIRKKEMAEKVAKLIAKGKTNVQIARILNTSPTTVSGLRSLANTMKLLRSV